MSLATVKYAAGSALLAPSGHTGHPSSPVHSLSASAFRGPAPTLAAAPRPVLTHAAASSGDMLPAYMTPEGARGGVLPIKNAASLLESLTSAFDESPRLGRRRDPPNWEAATQQVSSLGDQLSAHARDYIALLAESSTSAGGMQRHMIKMLARAVGDGVKVVGFLHDPLNPIKDELAKGGARQLIQKTGDALKSFDVTGNSVSSLSSVDDFYLPPHGQRIAAAETDPDNAVNPVHARLLSLLLSAILSGVVSSVDVAGAFPDLPAVFGGGGGPQVEQTVALNTAANTSGSSGAATTSAIASPFASASQAVRDASVVPAPAGQGFINRRFTIGAVLSLEQAPSVRVLASAQSLARAHSGAEAGLSAASMATGTAMRLMRADARIMGAPDLDNVLDSVLETINESLDEADGKPKRKESGGDDGDGAEEADER
ncbi:hypothetical protein FOA52_013223 [Chlamydomonas sp. UWO 241]|nr:hypothetical protein FOA52_013223 [Chlamydomonas sp. UWO 241]